jgi:hypothetical protein
MARAVDSEAAEFWRKRDFTPSKDDPLISFRSTAAIATSLSTPGQDWQDWQNTNNSDSRS